MNKAYELIAMMSEEKLMKTREQLVQGGIEDNDFKCLLLDHLVDMNSQLKVIRGDITKVQQSVDECNANTALALEKIKKLEARVEYLENNLATLKSENVTLSSHMKLQQEKCLKLEAQSRRENLVLDGIAESTPDDCLSKVKHIFTNIMKVQNVNEIKIERCHRLGPRLPNMTRPRPVIFKFNWFEDRQRVWASRQKLKGTNYWISEDFPQEIRDRRRVLQPIAKKARDDGMTASLSIDRLLINHKSYTTDNLHTLPANLKPSKVATPDITDTITAFFHPASPLSNFHNAEIEIERRKYAHVEQYYQKEKAVFANDPDTALKIMQTSSPYKCYTLGKGISVDKTKWNENAALQVMKKACMAKFTQHKQLQTFLLGTDERTLVEGNPRDLFWGAGLSVRDPLLKNQTQWKGKNHLRKILMEVRSSLKDCN